MAAVAPEPGAAAVPTVPPPEPRPPDPAQNLPGHPILPLGLTEPPLGSHKDEDRRHVAEKAPVSSEANAELMLMSIDCTEANANAELMLQRQDSPPELPPDLRPLKPLSDPGSAAEQDPVQSAVSPLSLPAALEAPEAPEAGLSLGQPNGPDRACTDRTLRRTPDRGERFTALREPSSRGTLQPRGEDPATGEDRPESESGPELSPELSPELRPGTHVRVSLDHVIDDALVVSFRVGHKVFSGVLMDLSRRFGPYGIPISVFPSRRESSRRHVQAPPPPAEAPPPPAADVLPSAVEAPPSDSALTPLFHQGAPYPPPLFLRDTYHTNLPQPPPRRIKRSRRRYGNSEEPTCMLVRLRPRQVLCDRCKGAAGPRAPPVSTRRRHNPDPPEENLSAEVKRLRYDEPRPPRPRREGPKAAGGVASAPLRRRDGPAPSRDGPAPSRERSNPHREVAARSSPRAAHRVLTRRGVSALTPPRIRLKPHRYRTDGEQDHNKTRPRPEPAGPQRSKTKARTEPRPTRPESRTSRPDSRTSRPDSRTSRPPNRSESRPGSKPVSKPGFKPGTKSGTKDPRPKAEPGPRKETKVQPKSEARHESQSETRTKPGLNQDRPRLDPDPESRPQPLSRSRRKQVFPRPTRDFDLDFMGWCGPDSDLDLDRTRPGLNPDPDLDLNRTEPGLNPGPQTNSSVRDKSPKLDQKTDSEFSETTPELDLSPDHSPVQALDQELDQEPDRELDRELDRETDQAQDQVLDQELDQEPDWSQVAESKPSPVFEPRDEGSEVPPDPGPQSVCGPKPEACGPKPESGPKSVKLESDSQTEPEPADCSSEPDPSSNLDHRTSPNQDLSPNQVLSPDPDPSADPVISDGPAAAEPRVQSRPSSPTSSSSSGSSRSRSRSRTSEQSQTQSQCSTRSKSVQSAAHDDKRSEQKLSESLSPRPDLKPDLRPDLRPDSRAESRPMLSRTVQKCVGADGRCVCVGDIMWAKIAGFPWWPARVLSLTVCRRGDGGGAAKQEARVAWFGSRTTSLLPLSHTSPFLETFQTRFDRKRKGPYRRAIAEAATAAKQLTPEVRALITHADV